MRELISEIAEVCPEFSAINMEHVLIGTSTARPRKRSGLLAYVVPLKFRDGSPVEIQQRGRKAYHFGMLPYLRDGVEILYIINFTLPRFYNLPRKNKLETIIHELYHISPRFNGDVRRFKGRSYLHGHSMKAYDAKIQELTRDFLLRPHRSEKYDFLRWNMREAKRRYGGIATGRIREPRPKLIKVVRSES